MRGRLVDSDANEVLLLPGQAVEQALIAELCCVESDGMNEQRASGCHLESFLAS